MSVEFSTYCQTNHFYAAKEKLPAADNHDQQKMIKGLVKLNDSKEHSASCNKNLGKCTKQLKEQRKWNKPSHVRAKFNHSWRNYTSTVQRNNWFNRPKAKGYLSLQTDHWLVFCILAVSPTLKKRIRWIALNTSDESFKSCMILNSFAFNGSASVRFPVSALDFSCRLKRPIHYRNPFHCIWTSMIRSTCGELPCIGLPLGPPIVSRTL